MNEIICTLCYPSRKKFDKLLHSIRGSLDSSGDHSKVNVVVRFDYDDEEARSRFHELEQFTDLRVIFGHRLLGYESLGTFTTECAKLGGGEWICLMNDDATLEGKDWVIKLEKINPFLTYVVHQEYHRLGESLYEKDPRGPCPWIPNGYWRLLKEDEIKFPPDITCLRLRKKAPNQEPLFLEGTTINHQHSPAWTVNDRIMKKIDAAREEAFSSGGTTQLVMVHADIPPEEESSPEVVRGPEPTPPPKISLMIHTASPDSFLQRIGIPSHARMVVEELNRQPWRDFELVYVDRWQDGQPDLFRRLKPEFRVKHVPVHPAHRFWYDRGYCWISAAKNTGILHSEGELLITRDDGAVYNTDDFFDLYWAWYKKGRFLNAGYCRWYEVRTENGLPSYPLDGMQEMVDIGRKFDGHVLEHEHGNWLFAGSSFSLEGALRINGFNERIDGTKGLEDCEFGIRLQLIGCKFVMDRSVYLHILDHEAAHGWDERGEPVDKTKEARKVEVPWGIRSLCAVENHGQITIARELGEVEANKHPLTDRHLEIIRQDTIKYQGFDPLAPENAGRLELWRLGAERTFNLREEWKTMRRYP